MKKIHILICMIALLSVTSCVNLDLNPPSAASSENWFSSPEEVRISLNDFYRSTFFVIEEGWTLDRNTDDWAQRTNIYTIAAGSLNASSTSNPNIKTVWSYTYKNISRANRILEALDKLEGKYSTTELNTLRAEARFFRAFAYSRLITLWGDVPFYVTSITPEEAFEMGRTDKAVVLKIMTMQQKICRPQIIIAAPPVWTKERLMLTRRVPLSINTTTGLPQRLRKIVWIWKYMTWPLIMENFSATRQEEAKKLFSLLLTQATLNWMKTVNLLHRLSVPLLPVRQAVHIMHNLRGNFLLSTK